MSIHAIFTGRLLSRVAKQGQSSTKCLIRGLPVIARKFHSGQVHRSDDHKDLDDKMNETPYPFMSTLKGNVEGRQESLDFDEAWEYQGFVVMGSISAFLLYFTLIRKEREVDRAIEETLYKGLPALEVSDLRKKIKKFKDDGKDVTELEARLKEVLTPPQNRNL